MTAGAPTSISASLAAAENIGRENKVPLQAQLLASNLSSKSPHFHLQLRARSGHAWQQGRLESVV